MGGRILLPEVRACPNLHTVKQGGSWKIWQLVSHRIDSADFRFALCNFHLPSYSCAPYWVAGPCIIEGSNDQKRAQLPNSVDALRRREWPPWLRMHLDDPESKLPNYACSNLSHHACQMASRKSPLATPAVRPLPTRILAAMAIVSSRHVLQIACSSCKKWHFTARQRQRRVNSTTITRIGPALGSIPLSGNR